MKQEIASEAVKTTPPVAAALYSWTQGWTSAQVLTWVSIGYVVLQAAYLVWQWRQKAKQADAPAQ